MAGPSIEVGSLPKNNTGDPDVHMTIDKWFTVAKPRAELVPSSTAGAVAVGPWDLAEKYYTLRGTLTSGDPAQLYTWRAELLDALPANSDNPIVVYGNGETVDLQVFVRLYDEPDIEIAGQNLIFAMPLVATDPLRYGTGLSGTMGVFTGSEWFTTFDVYTPPTPDVYYLPFTLDTVPTPDDAYMTFEQATSVGPFPPAVVLTSPGDAVSRRIKFEVSGPVTVGDWKLVHEQTGDELWADLELVAGQSVVFDCYAQTATMAGASVDHLVFGDWLTFRPGSNTYRLVAGIQTDGFADIQDALPAYR